MMSTQTGGLTPESRDCLQTLGMEQPSVFGVGEPPEDPSALFSAALRLQLCLTDEEAANLLGADGVDGEALRCLVDQMGGEDALTALFSDDLDLAGLLSLFAAAEECGVSFAPEGASPNSIAPNGMSDGMTLDSMAPEGAAPDSP